MRVTRLENGPPVGYPVQMRISGEHIEKVQAIARQVEAKVRENPHVMNVNLDWSEPSKVVRLVVDQERARALGVSSAQVSQFLSSSLAGQSVSVYREGNRQIEMLLRGPADERNQLELLSSLSMPTANGGHHAVAGGDDGVRLRGRHHLAPQPVADGDRARRHQ